MAEMLQNLDLSLIEKANERYSDVNEHTIYMEVDGEVKQFVVEIYKEFSPTKIRIMVEELIDKMDTVRKEDKRWETIMSPYIVFMFIKHFTTLELPNNFAQQLKAIEHMTNTGTMLQIFSAMNEEQVNEVEEHLSLILETFNQNYEEAKEVRQQVLDQLVDKSLME